MLGTVNITAEYALLAAFYLALREPDEKGKKVVITVDEISKETGIPLPFLAKIMIQLTRKNLVCSSRGRKGGYSLARESKSISLLDIVESISHRKGCHQCFKGTGFCPNSSICPLFPVWQELSDSIESILQKHTLHSLAVSIRNLPKELLFLKALRGHFSQNVLGDIHPKK